MRIEALFSMLEPSVNAVGMELWGIEYLPQGKHSVLRLFIDSEHGVTVDDCEAVSHQVSGVLDVEDPVSGQYSLEVSSPGLDRPLFTLEHFQRYVGETVKVRLNSAVGGKKVFAGILECTENSLLTFSVDGELLKVDFSQIKKANIAPLFD